MFDRDLHFLDATAVRAQRPAAGAHRPGAVGIEGAIEEVGEALGLSQGGSSTELHLRAVGSGGPIAAVLTAGERHERLTLNARATKAHCYALAGVEGTCVFGGRQGIAANSARQPGFVRADHRYRNALERMIGRLKQYRRTATGCEK